MRYRPIPVKKLFTLLLPLLFLLLTACSSPIEILHGLTEREANEVVVFLMNHNISAMKIEVVAGNAGGGSESLWDIGVAPNKRLEAMALLNDAGLPHYPTQNLLEIFKDSSLVPSDTAEKIRFQSGLAEQIASTIRKFDGIVDADVILSFPKENLLNPNAPKGKFKAAVFVKHTGVLEDANNYLGTKIRRLVASSVTGLSFDDVTLVTDRAPDLSVAEPPPNTEMVSLLGIYVVQNSATQFKIVFFSFFISIFLLFLLLLWPLWKLWPVLKTTTGRRRFFSRKPLFTSVKKEKIQKKVEDRG